MSDNVRYDLPFLLPRTVVLGQAESGIVDGHATLLISRYISPDVHEKDMDVECTESNSVDSGEFYDDCSKFSL